MSKKTRKKLAWLNPAQAARENVVEAQKEGGFEGVIDAYKSGDVTDPGGWLHNLTEPTVTDPGAPAQTDTTAAGQKARDRVRRLAMRAQGRASTIKVGSSAEPYTGEQNKLLGS